MLQVSLKQLIAFEAVVRLQNFTRAAEELNLSQPAVSMQVKQLEHLAQTPLIEQQGRVLAPTETGRMVLEHARSIVDEIEALSANLQSLKGLKRGRLRLATVTTVNYFMPTLLRSFCERYPGIHVSVGVANRNDLLRQLQDNETDIAIMGRPPEGLGIEAAAFLDNPLVIIGPKGHPLDGAASIPLAEMANQVFLTREPGSGTRNAMERFFREAGVEITSSIEVAGVEALKQGVQAGLGLAMMSRDAVELELALGRLVELDVEGLPIHRHWYLAHREKKRLSAPAQAFKEFIVNDAAALLGREP